MLLFLLMPYCGSESKLVRIRNQANILLTQIRIFPRLKTYVNDIYTQIGIWFPKKS